MIFARTLSIFLLLLCAPGINSAQQQDRPPIRNPGLPSGPTTIIRDPEIRDAPPASSRTQALTDSQWQTYASPDGDFTVSVPVSLAREENTPPAGINRLRQYSAQHNNIFYFIRVADIPGSPSSAMMSGMIRGMEYGICQPVAGEGRNCRFAGERLLSHQGLPLRHYALTVDDEERGTLRIIFGRGRFYIYGILRVPTTHPSVNRFLESFRLLPAALNEMSAPPPAAPSAPGNSTTEPATDPLSALAVVPYRDAGWREYTSLEGRFSAQFPGEPVRNMAPGLYTSHLTSVRTNLAIFTIIYGDSQSISEDPDLLRRVYDTARDLFVERSGARLVSEREIRHEGRLGREITLSADGSLVRSRMVQVGPRLYQLIVGGDGYYRASPARQRFLERVIERFFNSVRILEPQAPPSRGHSSTRQLT